MATTTLRNPQGADQGKVELPAPIFEAKIHRHAMWQVVTAYLNNQRQGTSQVKTRGMVSGGGKKPFRQKGTGRARQGTSRAAQYVGGARAFGPTPRDYHVDIPKKTRRLALRSALSVRAKEGKVTVLTDLGVSEGKTREVFGLLQRLSLAETKCLLVLEGNDPKVVRAARNLPRVWTSGAYQLNTYEVLRADHILITRAALDVLQQGALSAAKKEEAGA
jgi:large subunit ribosomal protein L4